MKWDSIKFRLLFMTAVCVLGMTLLVVSQHYFNRALLALSEQREELQELKQDLLQLRRHEKDFLLRKNPDYLTQFRVQHTQFVSALNGLDDIVKSYQLPSSLVGEIAESTQAYTEQLFKLDSPWGDGPPNSMGFLHYNSVQSTASRSTAAFYGWNRHVLTPFRRLRVRFRSLE